MSKIFYSMAGEGRGHATRVRALVEQLRGSHELVLFAPDEAHDFLAPIYADDSGGVRVERIPGLRFHYSGRRLDLLKTIRIGVHYGCYELGSLTNELTKKIEAEQPDLIITDFEPALPRAAKRVGVPYISLDHQHFLLAYDLSILPASLQRYAWMMGYVVRAYHSGATGTIISAFFKPDLKPGWEHVAQVGPILRPDVLEAEVATEDYFVSYLRRNTPQRVVDVLKESGKQIRIYGLGERPADGHLEFCPIHEQHFVDDLARCAGVICAAGNQLLGETLFLGKPVLAIPEQQHHEQLINSHFLRHMGTGDWVTLEDFSLDDVLKFMEARHSFQNRLDGIRGELNGTQQAVAAIERYLPAGHVVQSGEAPCPVA